MKQEKLCEAEDMMLVLVEPTLKYHPDLFEVLTLARYPGREQCMVGSLTGADRKSTRLNSSHRL